jgi:hypothetical protein
MHDRRTVLGGLGAAAALVATGARANVGMPAVIPQPEHSLLTLARGEMLAFLRQQLIMSVSDRRIYEVLIRINEALLTNHPDVVDPRLRMRSPVERLGGVEYMARTRLFAPSISIFDDPSDPVLYERDIRDVAEWAAHELKSFQTLIEKHSPGLRMRWLIPVKGTCAVDPVSFQPVYCLTTSYTVAPIGPWDA